MDDLISRQQAIDALKEKVFHNLSDEFYGAMQVLDALPSVQPERKKGTWTKDASCPFCGFQPWYERDIHTLSFCPNCGEDMRGETE